MSKRRADENAKDAAARIARHHAAVELARQSEQRPPCPLVTKCVFCHKITPGLPRCSPYCYDSQTDAQAPEWYQISLPEWYAAKSAAEDALEGDASELELREILSSLRTAGQKVADLHETACYWFDNRGWEQ